ncbi:hypothetical protein B0H19DRAFT_1251905 [Mycena capillaripes]|nr:hypothetical protein B0H19DRAFT_1251905 [Mycena capillaripes]
MPGIPEAEAYLSTFTSEPNNSAVGIVFTIFIFTVVVLTALLRYASPMRLTCALVDAIVDIEKTYLEAIETGRLSPTDIRTAEMLFSLQLKVSEIREANLRHSLSWDATRREFLSGGTFTVLKCIREVRELATHIEILKEAQFRENSNPHAVWFLRRCHSGTHS